MCKFNNDSDNDSISLIMIACCRDLKKICSNKMVKNIRDHHTVVHGKTRKLTKFLKHFYCIFHISSSISMMCQKNLPKIYFKLLFAIKLCTSLTYADCRVMCRVTKVALLNIFLKES